MSLEVSFAGSCALHGAWLLSRIFILPIVCYFMVKDFKRLDIWRLSIELNKKIYLITKEFPREEIYGLTSQVRRAAISISSNIAEGCGRSTNKDFVLFLHHAMGSLKEVECQVFLARELGFLSGEEFVELNNDTLALERKLAGYINYVRSLGKNMENKTR